MTDFNIETSVGFLLAKAHQRLYACFRNELAPFGVTPPQFALLAFLWKQDGLSQVELSEQSGVDRTTLSGLVDRLQQQGLAVRAPDPEDRRACRVELTAAGRGLENDLVPLAVRIRQQFSSGMTPQEYQQLCHLLNKLRSGCDD